MGRIHMGLRLLLQKSRSIDEIYHEARDFDRFITSDATLATALNKRVDRAFVGRFAATPLGIASEYCHIFFSKRPLSTEACSLKISREAGMPLRNVYAAIDRIHDILIHGKDPDTFLNTYDSHVWDMYRTLPTSYNALRYFDPSVMGGLTVAVGGLSLFTPLDKRVLPAEYTQINVCEKSPQHLSKTFVLDSDHAILSFLSEYITPENAHRAAVVTHPTSSIVAPFKAMLMRRGIPVLEKETIREHLGARSFIELLSLAKNSQEARVCQARPFFEQAGVKVRVKYDDYNVQIFSESLEGAVLAKWWHELKSVFSKTFAEALCMCPEPLREFLLPELESYGLLDVEINDQSVDDLQFLLLNSKKEVGKTGGGLILSDSSRVAFIDRPHVVYVGLDSSWTPHAAKAEYCDQDAELQKALESFNIMLTQGKSRIYLVSQYNGAGKTVPCYLFNMLCERDVKGFFDPFFEATYLPLPGSEHSHRACVCRGMDEKGFSCFSQSSLRRFFTCPKQYEYSRAIPTPERSYFLKGTLLHEFAQCYASDPSKVRDTGFGAITDKLVDIFSSINGSLHPEVERTTFCAGIDTVVSFLDSIDLTGPICLAPAKKDVVDENSLADILGIPSCSQRTELYFEEEDLLLKGKIDLVASDTWIVDYKSSKEPVSVSGVLKALSLDSAKDDVDFQPLAYLSYLRKHSPEKELIFTYLYLVANRHKKLLGTDDSYGARVDVIYHPCGFNDFLQDADVYELFNSSQKKKAFCACVGADLLASYFSENPIPHALQFTKGIAESGYGLNFASWACALASKMEKGAPGDYLKGIVAFRTGSRQKTGEAHIFKEDLDMFEEFVKKQHELMLIYRQKGFPRTPRSAKACKYCDYRDICERRW